MHWMCEQVGKNTWAYFCKVVFVLKALKTSNFPREMVNLPDFLPSCLENTKLQWYSMRFMSICPTPTMQSRCTSHDVTTGLERYVFSCVSHPIFIMIKRGGKKCSETFGWSQGWNTTGFSSSNLFATWNWRMLQCTIPDYLVYDDVQNIFPFKKKKKLLLYNVFWYCF